MRFALPPTLFPSSNLDALAGASAAILDYDVTLKINIYAKNLKTETWKESGTS